MLIIRPAQMEVFRRHAVDRFVDRMVRHVAAEYPARYEELGDAYCEHFVRATIDRAATYRIDREGAVAVFMELLLDYGDDLELAPDREWVMNILENTGLRGSAKVDMIRERVSNATGGRRIVPLPVVR